MSGSGSRSRVAYVTLNSISEGVGASQVLAYVRRIGTAGLPLTLHSFEKSAPNEEVRATLERSNVTWYPHQFGRRGSAGGLSRVVRAASAMKGTHLVHARSDLPAAAALISRPDRWLWDVRSLYADQKIELGELRAGSVEEKILRRVESGAARSSDAIVTLTEAVIPVLEERHGVKARQKAHVITTCVDLKRFAVSPLPPARPLRLLLSGTINAYYDIPLMLDLTERAQRRMPVELHLAVPVESRRNESLIAASTSNVSVPSDKMQEVVAQSHVGLCICRNDAGISLLGSMPTKIGEFLASGRPVMVNSGLVDAAALVEAFRCGVAVRGRSREELDRAVDVVEKLVEDPATPERCRALAEAHFNLDKGVERLLAIYASLLR